MRSRLLVLLAALPILAAPARAAAQPLGPLPPGPPLPGRVFLEAFYSEIHAAHDATRQWNGAGVRLLAPVGTPAAAARVWLGAFGILAEADALRTVGREGLRTTHLGVQLDVRPLRTSIVRRLDPHASFGIGMFRSDAATGRRAPHEPATPGGASGIESVDARRGATNLALSPGVGIRLRLSPQLALRGDVRDAMIPGSRWHHNTEVSGGVSLSR
jgi:hypothetical protein